MPDHFSMAYDDKRNALQLHIKVNDENSVLMSPEYKVGPLRIPDDPSWPKISQRKLSVQKTNSVTLVASNTSINNAKEMDTPVEPASQQSAAIKPCYSHQRNSCTYQLRRKPSYTDPRFKKVRSPQCETISSAVSISAKQSDAGGSPKLDSEKGDVTKQVEEGLNQKLFSQSVPLINGPVSHRSSSSQTNQIFVFNKKPKIKSEANLIVTGNQKRVKKLSHKVKPQTRNRQSSVTVRLLKKIKSYLEKNNSRPVMVDSTSIGSESSRHKPNHSHYNVRRLSNQAYVRRNSYIKSARSKRRASNKYRLLDMPRAIHGDSCNSECRECDLSPKTTMKSTTSYSRSIPLATQELLSRSYWRYYNKLREKMEGTGNSKAECLCHLLMGEPEAKRQKTETFRDAAVGRVSKIDSEMQTLEQCSALSSMINTALEPTLRAIDDPQVQEMYFNKHFKSSFLSSPEAKNHPSIFYNTSPNNKPAIEINSLIFLGSMIYLLIILLPLVYDYFFHKLSDDYENTSYAGLLLEYVSLSFKEAFDGVVNIFKEIISKFQFYKKYKPTLL